MHTCIALPHTLLASILTLLACASGREPASQAVGYIQSENKCGVHAFRPPQARKSRGYYCYKRLCWCSEYIADCSRNNGRLSFIPELPANVTLLNFSHNAVREILNYTFFQNATWITSLALEGNSLVHIVHDAFRLLTKLEYLTLSYNDLNNAVLPAVLSIESLRRLDMRGNKLRPFPDDTFHTYHLPNLTTLNLHNNFLGPKVKLSTFAQLPNLQCLGLINNSITKMLSDQMDSLYSLNMALNYLKDFPITCNSNETSLFPSLEYLLMNSNRISEVREQICLPQLHMLELSGNHFDSFGEENLHLHKLPNIIEVYLQSMHLSIKKIKDNAFRNPHLLRLSLMFNTIYFKNDEIDPRCFAGCPELNDLQLSHTTMDGVSQEKWEQLFGNLSKLNNLYIQHTSAREIPLVFASLTSLRKLSMSANAIATIPDGVFDTQPSLTVIELDKNQISVIRETTFSASTRQRLSHLDLSGNPFTCSCDVIWFRDWLVSDPKLFSHPWSAYGCSNIANTKLTSFSMNEQACLMDRGTYRFITASLSMLISSFTLLTLLYRYRWHLRLVIYEAFRGRGEARRWRLQRQDFLYDVFVSYAAPDLPWVREHLMPALEEGLGLRLCLHDRDFIIGNPIVDNIEESVQSSKTVLMLFSTHFARSEWCQFELTLCLSHVMQHEDALLVALLDDIPTHELTSAMMAVLRTTTYIEWAQHPDAVASFWGRMQIALQEILPAGRQHPEPH